MKIFATSDIHGNKVLVYLIAQIVKEENIDVLIISGDVAPKGFYQLSRHGLKYDVCSLFRLKHKEQVLCGNEQQIKTKLDMLGFIEISKYNNNLSTIKTMQKEKLNQICELLKTIDVPVYMLIGNDDHITSGDWDKILDYYGILNLNSKTCMHEDLKITGFQYILPTPWNTNNELTEAELAKKLESIKDQVDKKTILITHSPPNGVLDKLTTGFHVGSTSILNLIRERQPVFHIFGHIHEAFGSVKMCNTICCNTSCLWLDWLLRGYIIDSKAMRLKEIKITMDLSDFMRIYVKGFYENKGLCF